ncbi:MAG: hypothetical protein V4706_05455 [Pseudomonadota bacterium]
MLPSLSPNPAVQEIQPQVQRKLGRVLILIQQYEALLKAMIIESEIEVKVDADGGAAAVDAFRKKRMEQYRNMTLGMLVRELHETFLRTSPLPDDDSEPVLCPGKDPLRLRHHIQLAPEKAALIEADLQSLVTLRNSLVHHFIQQFDIFSVPGCQVALNYLEESYRTVETALNQLREWEYHMRQIRKTLSEFLQSQQFSDFMNLDESNDAEFFNGKS